LENHYDVIVIGAGLGGLTAAALLARAGRKVLVLERNDTVGGAASTYKVGDLVVEASLHETADPRDSVEPKNHILSHLGVLDAVQWVPTGPLYEVRGGPVGSAFRLPHGFPAARAALTERFPTARAGIAAVLGDMERIASGLGTLSRGRDAFRNPLEGLRTLLKLTPVVRDWRRSLHEVFELAFGDDDALKWALAANLPYYHDDPATLWWVFFAVAQGGYLGSGGCYVRGGSQQLSNALAGAVTAAGGEIATGRSATEIRLDAGGRPSVVAHTDKKGGDRAEATTRAIAGNAAPAVLGEMLAGPARERFSATYSGRRLSISVFSAVFGLAKPPAEFGFHAYSNFLLPSWIKRLADTPRCAGLLGAAPTKAMDPLMTVVDYSAIDAGLGGPPYPVSVVGLDRVENWTGLDKTASETRRKQWTDRIVEIVDREFPGFGANVVVRTFSSAHSIHRYLNAPKGAIYGFAPLPPRGPIWRGVDRSTRTPVSGLYLASSYAASGGFTGAIMGGAAAAECILAERQTLQEAAN
jgi:phytoene dehydrogenase-like protein